MVVRKCPEKYTDERGRRILHPLALESELECLDTIDVYYCGKGCAQKLRAPVPPLGHGKERSGGKN